jgi:hypothetical protein
MSTTAEQTKDDPWDSSLREIIDSFRAGGAAEVKEHGAANDGYASANANANEAGNDSGGEMGRGRNLPTDQGTPGRFNTLEGGQEQKQSDPPEKGPESNLPPDVKEAMRGFAKDLSGVKEAPGDSLSSQIAAAKEQTGAQPPERQAGQEAGRER